MVPPDRFTHRAADALERAAALAVDDGQQVVTALHLLSALLEDAEGVVPSAFGQLGVDAAARAAAARAARRRLPSVSGGGVAPYAAADLSGVLEGGGRRRVT
jgi:ATP-dependent Clp protease ATP-binding subunit ClpB